jgi:hypothetical protein
VAGSGGGGLVPRSFLLSSLPHDKPVSVIRANINALTTCLGPYLDFVSAVAQPVWEALNARDNSTCSKQNIALRAICASAAPLHGSDVDVGMPLATCTGRPCPVLVNYLRCPVNQNSGVFVRVHWKGRPSKADGHIFGRSVRAQVGDKATARQVFGSIGDTWDQTI